MTARGRSPFWRLVEAHGGTTPPDAPLSKAVSGSEIAGQVASVVQAHIDAWLVELLGVDVAGIPPDRIGELIDGGYLDPSIMAHGGVGGVGGLDPWGAVAAIGQALADADPDAVDDMRKWDLQQWREVLPDPAGGPGDTGGTGGPGGPGGPPAQGMGPVGGQLIIAPPTGLGDVEREAWIQARQRGAEYARGLGNIVSDDLQAKVVEVWDEAQVASEADREQRLVTRETIREATAEAVARGWSADRLASELGNKTRDWARNWHRIAATELQGAVNDAVVIQALRLDGPAGRIARIPETDACEACKSLFLDGAGRPRIFTVTEIVANGTNVGKKRDEWRPTIWPVHPHCLHPDTLVTFGGRAMRASDVRPGGGAESVWTSWYDGPLVHLRATGVDLRLTPNHLVLTPSGWVEAGSIQPGDDVFHESPQTTGLTHSNDVPPEPTQDALLAGVLSGFSPRGVPVAAIHLDGEVFVRECEIDQEDVDGVARLGMNPGRYERVEHPSLVVGFERSSRPEGPGTDLRAGHPTSSHRFVSGLGVGETLRRPQLRHADPHCVAAAAGSATAGPDHPVHEAAPTREDPGYLLYREECVEVQLDGSGRVKLGVDGGVVLVLGDDRRSLDVHLDPGSPLSRDHDGTCRLEAADRDATAFEMVPNSPSADADLTADGLTRMASGIELDDEVDVVRRELAVRHSAIVPTRIDSVEGVIFRGFVYNFTTALGWYAAGGVVAHNCRCGTQRVPGGFEFNDDWELVPEGSAGAGA